MNDDISPEVLEAIRIAKTSQAAAANRDKIHGEAAEALEQAIATEKATAADALEAHRIALDHAHAAIDALKRELGV